MPRRQAEYHAERQAALREAHQCIDCGRPAGTALCDDCQSHRRAQYLLDREEGICTVCSTDSGGHWACEDCRDKKNAAKRAARMKK